MATKTQIIEMLNKHNITDTNVVSDFLSLVSKPRSTSSNPPITFKGIDYHFCRNTSHYFTIENMTKDKDGKPKGNSTIGNSIYTQAQKHKKALLEKIDKKKDEIIALDFKSKNYMADRTILEDELSEIQLELDNGKYDDGQWMVDNFLSNLKDERINLFHEIAFTKEDLGE